MHPSLEKCLEFDPRLLHDFNLVNLNGKYNMQHPLVNGSGHMTHHVSFSFCSKTTYQHTSSVNLLCHAPPPRPHP